MIASHCLSIPKASSGFTAIRTAFPCEAATDRAADDLGSEGRNAANDCEDVLSKKRAPGSLRTFGLQSRQERPQWRVEILDDHSELFLSLSLLPVSRCFSPAYAVDPGQLGFWICEFPEASTCKSLRPLCKWGGLCLNPYFTVLPASPSAGLGTLPIFSDGLTA